MADMTADCTSCGDCVRSCAFLQQNGTPSTIAKQGTEEGNLLAAFACSLCGLCDAVCPEGLSPSALFLAMRQEAVQQKLINLEVYSPWLTYEKLGGSPLFRRDLIPDHCTTVFFPGCALPGTRPAAIHELFNRLRSIEPTAGIVLDCCGKISHDLGLMEQFTTIFGRLADRLARNGITRILTSCPGCSKILAKYGSQQFEISSIYELLAAAGPAPKTTLTGSTVVIHDPCPARFDFLQQQSVRTLVQSCGYQVVELPDHGRTTRCCGQGGMVEGAVSGTIRRESRIIATEAAGRPVISSCAACCDTLSGSTPTLHVADLLGGNTTDFSPGPVSSIKRWLNRLKLRFVRF